jgi:hypothetical protein
MWAPDGDIDERGAYIETAEARLGGGKRNERAEPE